MACVTGTNIVNDGLVFHFDLENGAKSWKGKPTTNLYTTASKTFTETNQYPIQPPVDSVQNGGMWTNFNWSGDINIGNVYAGEYITVSGWYLPYTTDLSIVKTVHIGLQCWSSRGSEGVALNAPNWNEWVYFEYTRYVDADVTGFRIEDRGYDYYYPDNAQYTSAYWCNVQIERSEFATKFVNGVRLSTASIIDVSPTKSTITAANLTYTQDDTPTFDGTNDYLTIPQPNVSVSPNNWTIEGWIKSGNQTSFFITPNSNGIDNFLRYDAGGQQIGLQVCEIADKNGRTFLTGSGSVPHNTWTHFTASINNLSVKMHINGELKHSSTQTIGMSGWSGIWQIGQRGNGTNYLLGELDGIKVYNRELTTNEVKQNFEAKRTKYGI